MRIRYLVLMGTFLLAGCGTVAAPGAKSPADQTRQVGQQAGVQAKAAAGAPALTNSAPTGQSPVTLGHASGTGTSSPQTPGAVATAPSAPQGASPQPKCLPKSNLGIACGTP